MATTSTNKYAVPALDKGLDILEYLVSHAGPKTQSEIAQGLGRGANEIYRVLIGLEARGYLVRDESSGRYSVSLKIYNLSRSLSPIDQMRECALPHMEDLAVKIGESCHLSMLYQSQTMVLIHARCHSPISINIAEGTLFQTFTSTPGKVLLANSNESVRAMILERDKDYKKLSKAKQKKLFGELAQIKQSGFYSASNVLTKGVNDFSVIIGEPEGKVIAALTVSSLNASITHELDEQAAKELVITTAKTIAKQLGC
ncbi:MAG: IclR family transcriptional regulator [Thalassotalea sp.]